MRRGIQSWKLFTIWGVDVGIHVSLLLLLIYLFAVSAIQLPMVAYNSGVDPYLLRGSPSVWGILFSISLVFSILLHELGHVLLAKTYGAKVSRITLLMLGGLSEIEGHKEKPAQEWKVAAIGPLVSLGIGAVLFALRGATDIRELRFYCYWVGSLNVTLGIFNLLPAFPMDGGRILRAFLVSRKGKAEGTRKAVSVSRVLAWVIGLIGLVQFNFILVFIAFFLYAAAQAELLVVMGEGVLKGLRVREVMSVVPFLRSDQSLEDAARMMTSENCAVLPVEDGGDSYGTISVEAIKKIPRDLWYKTPVDTVEEEVRQTLQGNDSVEDVLERGLSSEAIPVISDGHVAGLLRSSRLLELIRVKGALSGVWIGPIFIVAACIASGCGVRAVHLGDAMRSSYAYASTLADSPPTVPESADFVALSKRVVPSVVNISTTSTVKGFPMGGPDDRFRRFFEEFFGGMGDSRSSRNPPRKGASPPKAVSLGTGFIIDKSGLILTNNHVVADAEDIKIMFTESLDERPSDGKVVGRDAELDIALIRSKTKRELVPLTFGDSDALQVGEYVIAVGNPFGQGHSVTHGIISAKGRINPTSPFSTYLQTDAPINPGNSGGPLVNMRGEVIGVNNAIDARAQGIGFAIAANPVKRVLAELEKSGSIERGYLGLLVEPLRPEVAEKIGLSSTLRAPLVTSVAPGEAADKAGIKPYDVITGVDDKRVETPFDLMSSVTAAPVGKSIKLKISRKGREMEVTAKIAKRPTAPMVSAEKEERSPASRIDVGMDLENARVDGVRKKGVLVTRVDGGGPADEAGLVPGDVIIEVDQKETPDLNSFFSKLNEKGTNLLRVLKIAPSGFPDTYTVAVLDLRPKEKRQ